MGVNARGTGYLSAAAARQGSSSLCPPIVYNMICHHYVEGACDGLRVDYSHL